MRSRLPFLFTLLVGGLSLAPSAPPVPGARALEHNREIIENSVFNINRSLEEYGRILGPAFRLQVSQLRAGDLWVDFGAGNAIALKEYLTAESVPGFVLPPLSQRARVAALGVQAPLPYDDAVKALVKRGSDTWADLDPKLDSRVEQVVQQRGAGAYTEKTGYLHALSDEGIRGIRLATSLHGVFSYDEHLDVDLARVLSLLKPTDGELFMRLPSSKRLNFRDGMGIPGPPEVAEARARESYFLQVSGARLMPERGFPEGALVRFRREISAVSVPQLELTSLRESAPPYRSYRPTGARVEGSDVPRGTEDGIRRLSARPLELSCWARFKQLARKWRALQ